MLLLPKVAPVLAPMVCHAPRLARCSGEDACSDARVREHAEIHRIEQGAGGRVLDGGLGCLLIRRASPPSRAQVPAHGSPVIDARGSMCTATVVSCQSRTLLFARCCCCRCRCCRSCRSCRSCRCCRCCRCFLCRCLCRCHHLCPAAAPHMCPWRSRRRLSAFLPMIARWKSCANAHKSSAWASTPTLTFGGGVWAAALGGCQ